MNDTILNNESLIGLIKSSRLSKEQEDFLIAGLDEMNMPERIELLEMLKNVLVLNHEEAQAIEIIKKTIKPPEVPIK